MFQIKKLNLKSMPITCFLCTTLLKVKTTSNLVIPTFASKLSESNVIEMVYQNHLQVEPFETIVNDAVERFNSRVGNKHGPIWTTRER